MLVNEAVQQALGYPLGHVNFVKYPYRWLLLLNTAVTRSSAIHDSVNELIWIARNILHEGEHLPPKVLGHVIGVLLWASYRTDKVTFCESLWILVEDTSLLEKSILLPQKDKISLEMINIVLGHLKQSTYYSKNTYLEVVIDLLNYCFDSTIHPKFINITKILNWKYEQSKHDLYGDSINRLQTTVTLSFELFSQNKCISALKLLSSLVKCNVTCYQQLGLWNAAVVIAALDQCKFNSKVCFEFLDLCASSCETNSLISFGYQLTNHEVTLAQVYQQLSYRYYEIRKLAKCGKYCLLLQEIYSRTLMTPDLEATSLIYRNDLAYLMVDTMEQQRLLNDLQIFQVDDILDEKSNGNYQSQALALCCVLLTQAFVYLDDEDLHKGYEYFILSYQRSLELEGDPDLHYAGITDRYFGQLNSLHGYFLLLQGGRVLAAHAYGKSYAYDSSLTLALYNQCLLLVHLGKLCEAKNNWESAHIKCSDANHCYSKLTVYLLTK